jgi:hypothetical protein
MKTLNEINKFLLHENYYAPGVMLNDPQPMPGQSQAVCVYRELYKTELPKYTMVLPIHNQEDIIVRNMKTYFEHTTGTYELIIILDNCVDNTEREVLSFLNSLTSSPPYVGVIVIRQDTPIYETPCDNIAFRLARGTYALHLQPDMQMVETGYNESITRPFEKFDDVLGVSGRGCHTFRPMHGPGKLGGKMENPLEPEWDRQRNTFFVGETCMRGPLVLHTERLRVMKYWDEHHFFLGKDERDLFARSWDQHKWVCGYVPMEFKSPRRDGSTRKKKSPQDAHFRKIRQQRLAPGYWGEHMKHYATNKREIQKRKL